MVDKRIKLHLGCQEKYLRGYVNIDLPPDRHTVQKVKADRYADVRELHYESCTIDEIRSHHLLEHFSRREALTLLARWHKWLRVGGLLVIETPDFEESARKFLQRELDDQFKLGRHIFGSHETDWAYHLDFWHEAKFRYVLSELGYGDFKFDKFSSNVEKKLPLLRGNFIAKQETVLKRLSRLGFNFLPNIVCYACKTVEEVDYKDKIKNILQKSLIGREKKILEVWLKDVEKI